MTLKSQSFLLLFFFLLSSLMLLSVSAEIGNRAKPPVGSWSPIVNVTAPRVQKVAKFAVTQHNKEAKAKLMYQGVVSGETQVGSGTIYRLVIEAKEGAGTDKYVAVVHVKPIFHFMKLISFAKQVDHPPPL